MTELDMGSLIKGDSCSNFFKAKILTESGTTTKVRISDAGVEFEHKPTIGWNQIHGWEFPPKLFCLAYQTDEATKTLVLKLKDHDLEILRQAFHLIRLKRYAAALSPEKRAHRHLKTCSACGFHVSLPNDPTTPCTFCPECLAIFSENEILTEGRKEPYNFCQSGFFRMIGKQSRQEWLSFAEQEAYHFKSFRREVAPTIDKIIGHTLWTGLWLALLTITWYAFHWGYIGEEPLTKNITTIALYGFMGLVGLHLTFLGFYAAGMVMSKAMRALLFPHPYEKIAQRCSEGRVAEAKKMVKGLELQKHPGMLANLAVAEWKRGEHEEARKHALQAYKLCPNHPVLIQFNLDMAPPEDKDQWKQNLKNTLPHNQLTVAQTEDSLATLQSCSEMG